MLDRDGAINTIWGGLCLVACCQWVGIVQEGCKTVMLLKQGARLSLGRVLSLCQYRDGALRANGRLGAWMVLEERVKIKHLPSPHLRFPPQRAERGAHLPCGQGGHQAPGGE